MRTLLTRLFSPDTRKRDAEARAMGYPTMADHDRVYHQARIEHLERALQLAREQRDQAITELATARAIIDDPDHAAGHWKRQYDQQVRTNTALDNRLAAVEGRPIQQPTTDASSGRPGGRARVTDTEGASRG